MSQFKVVDRLLIASLLPLIAYMSKLVLASVFSSEANAPALRPPKPLPPQQNQIRMIQIHHQPPFPPKPPLLFIIAIKAAGSIPLLAFCIKAARPASIPRSCTIILSSNIIDLVYKLILI